MSLLDSATSSYIEAVTSSVPLHRAALFFIATIYFILFRTGEGPSLVVQLLYLPISDLAPPSGRVLKNVLIGDLIVGAAFVAASSVYARIATKGMFSLALRSTDLVSRIEGVGLQATTLALRERKEAADLAEASLERPAKRLRAINRQGEFLGGIGLLVAFFGVRNSLLDLAIGVFLIAASLAVLVHATRVFMSEYFGIAMYIARLLGRELPSPTELR